MVIVPIEFSPAFSFKQKSVLGNKKLRNPEITEFFLPVGSQACFSAFLTLTGPLTFSVNVWNRT